MLLSGWQADVFSEKKNRENRKLIERICEKDLCSGCFACMNICPKDAISAAADEYGVTGPQIDASKCIECGACIRVCPANHPVSRTVPSACYAAWSRDKTEREKSTSGGIASEISKQAVIRNGVVYGAAFDENLKLCHSAAENQEDLEKFRGSKYVQSAVGYTMREIREKLREGRTVLFVGTPCQAAGLRNYLGKDYENLWIVDLICHGTPPAAYLEDHIRHVTGGRKAEKISFRDGTEYCLTVRDSDGIIYKKTANCDYYLLAFLRGIIQRPNCSRCVYASSSRCADISLGDFWKLDRSSLKNRYRGRISAVLINTPKGEKIWELCREQLVSEERSLEEAVRGNGPLKGPCRETNERRTFLENVCREGFSSAVRSTSLETSIKRNERKYACFLYRAARKIKRKLMD